MGVMTICAGISHRIHQQLQRPTRQEDFIIKGDRARALEKRTLVVEGRRWQGQELQSSLTVVASTGRLLHI